MTEIDGRDIHFVKVGPRHRNALPTLITPGRPESILAFARRTFITARPSTDGDRP
jgi:hypothetical protein